MREPVKHQYSRIDKSVPATVWTLATERPQQQLRLKGRRSSKSNDNIRVMRSSKGRRSNRRPSNFSKEANNSRDVIPTVGTQQAGVGKPAFQQQHHHKLLCKSVTKK
jgi:hypothetical protein